MKGSKIESNKVKIALRRISCSGKFLTTFPFIRIHSLAETINRITCKNRVGKIIRGTFLHFQAKLNLELNLQDAFDGQ